MMTSQNEVIRTLGYSLWLLRVSREDLQKRRSPCQYGKKKNTLYLTKCKKDTEVTLTCADYPVFKPMVFLASGTAIRGYCTSSTLEECSVATAMAVTDSSRVH